MKPSIKVLTGPLIDLVSLLEQYCFKLFPLPVLTVILIVMAFNYASYSIFNGRFICNEKAFLKKHLRFIITLNTFPRDTGLKGKYCGR